MERGGCVYIMTNKNKSVLYVGATSDIHSRTWEHKNKFYPKSFTARYNCDILVYYKFYSTIEETIAVEKLVKGTNRKKKEAMINEMNPDWKDLFNDDL